MGREDRCGTRDLLGAAPTAGVRFTETGLDHLHTLDLVFTDNGDRLAVVEELHALFLGVLHLFARAGHVGFVTTVGSGHRLGALANRRAVAVHRRVTAAEHHDLLAFHDIGRAHV